MTDMQTSKTKSAALKKKSTVGNKTKQIAIRVTADEHQKFSARATSQGKTDSELARELLEISKIKTGKTPMPLDRAHVYGLCLTMKTDLERMKLAVAQREKVSPYLEQFEVEIEELQKFASQTDSGGDGK